LPGTPAAETVLDESLVNGDDPVRRVEPRALRRAPCVLHQLTTPDNVDASLDVALGGDKEQVEVDLATVPAEVERIVIAVYVNDGPGSKRALGQLRSCVVRVLNRDGNTELVRSEDLAAADNGNRAVVWARCIGTPAVGSSRCWPGICRRSQRARYRLRANAVTRDPPQRHPRPDLTYLRRRTMRVAPAVAAATRLG